MELAEMISNSRNELFQFIISVEVQTLKTTLNFNAFIAFNLYKYLQ